MVEENVCQNENCQGEDRAQVELEQAAGINNDAAGQMNENEDYKKRFYYLAAEMENMKKRFEREKSNLLKYGTEKILSGLVDVVDNLERCMDTMTNDQDEKVAKILTGIKMVREQFIGLLADNGLKKISAFGEIFNPNFHEALAQQEVEGKKDLEIIQVYQQGYMLQDRLLRPAKVVVAKVPEPREEASVKQEEKSK